MHLLDIQKVSMHFGGLKAIHEAEILSSHVGIHALKYKVAGFTIASTLAAMTGALYAHYHMYIIPPSSEERPSGAEVRTFL